MRKISAKIGVTAVFALALFALSISQAFAPLGGGGGQAPPQVDCSDPNQSIQAAVDIAVDGDIITVSGTCTEIVTVTTDGITLQGDPNVGGTLMGGVIFDGTQRGVIDDLIIDGSTNTGRVDGVRVQNNGHATVRNSTIVNHTRSAVHITSTSSGLVEGNTIGNNTDYGVNVNLGSFALLRGTAENPTQTITSASNFSCCGNAVGVFGSSDVRLNGGNEIEGTGSAAALSVFVGHVRVQNGLNTVLGTGGRAIDVGRNSAVELRWFVVTGRIGIFTGSHVEIIKKLADESGLATPPTIAGVINGDIRVRSGAHVQFSSPNLARNAVVAGQRQGSVTVNGRLDCGGNQGHVGFSTAFGQTIQLVFPSQADREASQCNNFNGFPVLPVFGP